MGTKSGLVKPELPSGFKDYTPRQMLARARIIATVTNVYRRFGFVPLQTSTGHRREVLTGGEPIDKRLWNMTADGGRESTDEAVQVTARFDLTVTLARFVAEHIAEIMFPFRRYEIGNVFRGERAQAGRYCEFAQFDADIVGTPIGLADAEIIVVMDAVMTALGISRFQIRVNNRKVLDGFAQRIGCATGSPEAAALLRLFDKIDDLGLEGVLARLAATEALKGEWVFAFDEERIARVRTFMALCEGATNNDERLARLAGYFDGEGVGAQGVAELAMLLPLIRAAGVNESHWLLDPSIVRGLGYYTGTVFETLLLDRPKFGSVFSGGRFDDLLARFTGNSMPAVGTSVGVDRLFAALETLGLIEDTEPDVDAFIVSMDQSLATDYFAIAAELRAAGVRTEIGMPYQNDSTKAQMVIAISRRAKVALFLGDRDKAAGTVEVKRVAEDKKDSTQTSVPRGELVSHVLTILGRST